MAYNDSQNESPLPTPGNTKRTAADLLPKFFRTEANRKFLQGTIDQLIQPGVAEKLNGFVGRKTAKAYKSTDNYIGDVSIDRGNYQLEPVAVIKDNLDNVTFYKDYNDYLGSLRYFGANTDNASRLNSQDTYAWAPHIDYDKFVNFREYYWLPNGPLSIQVSGEQRDVVSTYSVSTVDDGDNVAYVFNDTATRNPTLKLYRGQTYRFEINTPGYPLAFSVNRIFDDSVNVSTLLPDGVRNLDDAGQEVAIAYIEKGTIEFTVPYNAAERVFYLSKNSIDTSGLFRIYDIESNTFLDVADDILGKKTYQTATGLDLSNGMKLTFVGNITPAYYANSAWYVEGVGTNIRLINEADLVIPAAYSTNKLIPYDSDQFDRFPFANASSYAKSKDYILSNRASKDRNAWSRYNRWFHKDVITASFEQADLPINIDEETRAKRPIIEFEAGLKLYSFGTEAKADVTLIDDFTKDVFSTIEGQLGYNVDNVDLTQGMRVLFTADTDVLINGKIYEVNFINVSDQRQISLVEVEDSEPKENETVLVTQGKANAGVSFYYNNTWKKGQLKETLNQAPRFDLCDCQAGNRLEDPDIFDSTTFNGTKLFSYRQGLGSNDLELGFPLAYRNIENSGDILFDFNLLSDKFTYQADEGIAEVTTGSALLRKYSTRTSFEWLNGWSKTPVKSKQYVIRQYEVTNIENNNFRIDVYKDSGLLNDLTTIVYVNNKLQLINVDYKINRINKVAIVQFDKNLLSGDIVQIKTDSKTVKNNNGYYEFPHNLERNPLNEDIKDFTLGEVIAHVDSLIEEVPSFAGAFPGPGNLRDLGDVSRFGKKFVKHSGSINFPLYHTTSKEYNIVKALRYSRDEYAKFKRIFLETATTLGFDGNTSRHVDKILERVNKDKIKTQPFYFSDMIAYGPNNIIEYQILDSRTELYALNNAFDLETLSASSVLVYLNGKQLTVGQHYTFDPQGFVVVNAGQQEGDILELIEYEVTDGSFVAPTPSKLGLYPKFSPELTIDDTYQTTAPANSGPYKVYGEQDVAAANAARGWFRPVYTTKSAAKTADQDAGGSGQVSTVRFKGLTESLYIANSAANILGGQDDVEIDAYPVGIPFIRGHDGSYVRAYLDFRDELLLDFEKRIFNNIKVQWSEDVIDVDGFFGGDFRPSEFSSAEINKSLSPEFTQWLKLVDNDYTDNFFYDRTNEFTYNYSNANNLADEDLLGFWRAVYKQAFDTDRPHSHPWEMLGFRIKPLWWNESYGSAPYTGDNLNMWRDLEQGIVREPGKNIIFLAKFARPGLVNFIPSDQKGKLKSPLASSYVKNFILRLSTQSFKFGDQSPVETAWRRSSQYPFSVVTTMLLNQPAKVFAAGYDVSRITTNLVGQQVYSETRKFMSNADVVFPNTSQDSSRVLTSGFVNYIYNLVAGDILSVYSDYQLQFLELRNQLGFKLAGFSDKSKINLVLESTTPRTDTQAGVFVPQENYEVVFNTSSPVDFVIYSGVAIEKTAGGFLLRGYNNDMPFLDYYAPRVGTSSVDITVGGISEIPSAWQSDTQFYEGQVIENNNVYYRATARFRSAQLFSTDNLAKLPKLPVNGGKSANFKKNFDNRKVLSLQYGERLESSQEVIDFLLGYGQRLEDLGFDFNYVENETVNNWNQAAKEFLFWSTQGWAAGTAITISPAANKVNFKRDFTVVDNIFDNFYTYSLLKADGLALLSEYSSLLRDQNSFGIQTVNTDDGLYSVALALVQKEHVVVIDNRTIFNDIIYEPSTGYRRDRIKIVGYRSGDWNGGLNIPGFVYDGAVISEWASWKDFQIGSLVKYKQFYYVATENVPGSKEFNTNLWYRLSKKPEAELITNFDYRINQFTDFYDLDTDGFDAELQRMAQHLTGYQKRQYLANIITDDVSQYKFYQGMIQDKGTKNALSKMFEKLGAAGKESLEFFEEWAIQVGRYGAIDNTSQIEINLKQDQIRISPQTIELTDDIPLSNLEKVYRIKSFELYDKPANYTGAPFFTKPLVNEYVRTAGYVDENDVTFVAGSIEDLRNGNVDDVALGEYIWITEILDRPWDVYQHVTTGIKVSKLLDNKETNKFGDSLRELTLDRYTTNRILVGDIIGVRDTRTLGVNGFYEVDSIDLIKLNVINIRVPTDAAFETFADENFQLTLLRSVRLNNLLELQDVVQDTLYQDQTAWIDNYNGDWAVLNNSSVYTNEQALTNPVQEEGIEHKYGNEVLVTADNNNVFVTAPEVENGKVYYYRRSSESFNVQLDQEISFAQQGLMTSFANGFASSVSVSPDGEYLIAGLPQASGVKTRFQGLFDPDATYTKNQIVKFRESLWRANRTIFPQISTQPFSTFSSYNNIIGSFDDNDQLAALIIAGDSQLANNITNHILVRAPKEMYQGTTAGDKVNLFWNARSYSYPTLDFYEPFDGLIPEISSSFLNQEHIIKEKIDHVFYVELYTALPSVNDRVTTDTGQATVYYVSTSRDGVIIYLKESNGTFETSGQLFIDNQDLIGVYTEEDTVSTNDAVTGFWYIETPTDYSNNGVYYDAGKGLVYADVRIENETREVNDYYNIQLTAGVIGNDFDDRNQASFVAQLSFTGDLTSADGQVGPEVSVPSSQWLVRTGKVFSDTLVSGDQLQLSLFESNERIINFAPSGLTGGYSTFNKLQTIVDMWDGYIDFNFTRFDAQGFVFQPQIGDVLEDLQMPRNGQGGLAITGITTSSAEVTWVQRNFNQVRVYVKNITGTWDQLNNIGRYNVKRNRNTAIRGQADVDRIIGVVEDSDNDICVGNDLIGKLIVFEADEIFADSRKWNEIIPITGEEYWFYTENIAQGAGRVPNPPFSLNKDYVQIYHIEADNFGTAGPVNEGAVAIYRRLTGGTYSYQRTIVSEYGMEDRQFGRDVEIRQVGNYYTLFVSSIGNGDQQELVGGIEIFRHGALAGENFKGNYAPGTYIKGDIVTFEDDYYVANKDQTEVESRIKDSIFWANISWKQGKDSNYRGEWNNSYGYAEGSIVFYNDKFYSAVTNISTGAGFVTTDWKQLSNLIDYVGFLPNVTGFTAYNEEVFESSNTPNVLVDFSKAYDISSNGQVIVTTATITGSDSTVNDTRVLIYRETDNKFLLSQIINAPELQNSTNWAYKISMRPDGMSFAISASLDDSAKVNQGQVYIYMQVDSEFVLTQTLLPPNNEEGEQFGYDMSYGQDNLVISSLNGDQKIPTTFDLVTNNETIIDNRFTRFNETILDSGVVYIFETLNDQLVFSERFRYDSATSQFGETLLSNGNHVYVGIPSLVTTTGQGVVVDYRKPKGKFAWNVLRESIVPVDISKIQGVFVYNKRTNEIITYLDYIDPVQGKIAGIAEQDITYKIGTDPAAYNVGILSDNTVDVDIFWAEKQVGQVWWNINTARFEWPYQGSISYQKEVWNVLAQGASIDVYEWVETQYTPLRWDALSATDAGSSLGITGTSLYGDEKYSARLTYDDISQTFSTVYYFWVQNKRDVPVNRTLSIFDITNLIRSPREQGYRFVSFLSDSRMVLNNFENIVTSDDVVLNIRYDTRETKIQNTHLQYLLMSDGSGVSKPTADIERKWFDSLIGFDENNRPVPNPAIPIAKRTGIQNRPRQGMFVNRTEALKQFIERVNLVLSKNLVVDQYQTSRLFSKDDAPSIATRKYDIVVDTTFDLDFLSINKITPARLEPVIVNGKIIQVNILSSGRGYKIEPTVEVAGAGKNFEVKLSINNLGQVTTAIITNEGSGYGDATVLLPRRYSVLVNNDDNLNGKWAIYSWNEIERNWFRTQIQAFDVSRFWDYRDWYAEGFNQFTDIDFEIEGTYLLGGLRDTIGNVVKAKSISSGGWLLLKKIANEETEDFTINYDTIGRQAGTISFNESLYNVEKNAVGFDSRSYDSFFYDSVIAKELRIIFEVIRDDLFIAELAVEYNQLFFASLRYVLSEQPAVDWMFKSAFINVKHNVGNLDQKVNFENDKLASYQAYVNEVKPYSSKVREFISSYTSIDDTQSAVTDFDLAPQYDILTKRIVTSKAFISNGELIDAGANTDSYPRKYWKDNIGYTVTEVRIQNPGSGYTIAPEIKLEGASAKQATAKAFIGYGKITAIKVTSPGVGYINMPTVIIDVPQSDVGIRASATAILGDGVVRTPTVKIKFDRTSGQYTIEELAEVANFVGSNVDINYNLKWPMDLDNRKVKVYVNEVQQLRSQYSYTNITYSPTIDTLAEDFNYGNGNVAAGPGTQQISNGYTYQQGRIIFTKPPANQSDVRIEYYRPISMLSAADRIKFAYNPLSGMLGSELAQVMTGIDYGGVEVSGLGFEIETGWDTEGWYTDTWDTDGTNFEDEVFVADGSTTAVELREALEDGVIYNIYKNGIRLDDPEYGTAEQVNQNAVTSSIFGDGSTSVVELADLGITLVNEDVLIIRKSTSDGSVAPDDESYDQALIGGNLAYSSARGINPEEIIVDGDSFITPTTSGGPEELVSGQVMDALDLRVYNRDVSAATNVSTFAYRQFKDILNRTHFKRLNSAVTTLAQPLNSYDLRIEVQDGANLAVPDKGRNLPGIIFIDKERIEYFVKDGNTLRQLRRGTLGTGTAQQHAVGTKVYDQNSDKTIPYKDRTIVQNFTTDGVTGSFAIGFTISSVNEIEVFVAGTRLRKQATQVFDATVALNSPDGDISIPADFEIVDGEIVLTTVPAENVRVTVVKKVGNTWAKPGESLATTNTPIANFLRAGTSAQPE